jgi:hypothetical protein
MLYYIYYGYITGVTAYKLYEYWEIAKTTYTTCNYTYIAINGVYRWVKTSTESVEIIDDLSEWVLCDDIKEIK